MLSGFDGFMDAPGFGGMAANNPVSVMGTVIMVVGAIIAVAGIVLAVFLRRRGRE